MLRKLLIALGLTAALLVLAEAFVHLAAGPPASFLYSGSFRDHQTDWDITYGVTGHNRRVSCPDNASAPRKIAVIGDSFVFGQGVPDCQDLVSKLNGFFPGEIRFVNLGVISIGLDEYHMIVRDFIDDSYDGVILVLYGNDVPGPRSFMGKLANRFSVFALLRKASRAWRVRNTLAGHDTADARPFNNIESILELDQNHFVRVTNPDKASLSRLDRFLTGLLKETTKHVRSSRIWVTVVPPVAVLAEPVRAFISKEGGTLPPYQKVGEFCRTVDSVTKRNGIGFIEVFNSLTDTKGAYHMHDLHLTARGHQTVADLIHADLTNTYANSIQ